MAIDVMVDLETTGTEAGCCVLSIGACTFDERYTFYKKISIDSSYAAGLKDSPDTMAWWSKQSPEARKEAFSGIESLHAVLGDFADWVERVRVMEGAPYIWGNGADFDNPILKAAYSAAKMKWPFGPFVGRCYRTLKSLPWSKDIKPEEFVGVKHKALDDAVFQARHALKIIKTLNSQIIPKF